MKVRREGDRIIFTALCDKPFGEETLDALTTAVAEIQADFPDCVIDEHIIGSNEAVPAENLLENGWVYRRAEP